MLGLRQSRIRLSLRNSRMNKMGKQIISFSGGKDSSAMLLRMIELKYPIDEIIFCDTQFRISRDV